MNKANMKLLGLYEILLGTHFDHWVPVQGTPKGALHWSNLDFFEFDLPTQEATEH